MMSDLIDRQAAIDVAKGPVVMQGIRSRQSATAAAVEAVKCIIVDGLRDLPPAQPKQRTGHWHITDAYPHNVYCSECHKRFAQTHWAVWEDGSLPRNFCPNCGADMREVTT